MENNMQALLKQLHQLNPESVHSAMKVDPLVKESGFRFCPWCGEKIS